MEFKQKNKHYRKNKKKNQNNNLTSKDNNIQLKKTQKNPLKLPHSHFE